MTTGARLVGRRLVLLSALLLAVASAPAQEFLGKEIGRFAEGKATAEEAVHMLKMYADRDRDTMIGGMRRYAQARSAFNGLIEQLSTEAPPSAEAQAAFDHALDAATDKCNDFFEFVQSRVLASHRPGGKGAVGDLVAGAGGLVKNFTDAGLAIYRQLRSDDKEQRTEVLDRLDRLKWQPFAQVP